MAALVGFVINFVLAVLLGMPGKYLEKKGNLYEAADMAENYT